jgi:hypothetical protein
MILNFRAVPDVNKPTMNTVCSHLLNYTLLTCDLCICISASVAVVCLILLNKIMCVFSVEIKNIQRGECPNSQFMEELLAGFQCFIISLVLSCI